MSVSFRSDMMFSAFFLALEFEDELKKEWAHCVGIDRKK